MPCSINLTELFDLAGQNANILGSWYADNGVAPYTVDCCDDCSQNPIVQVCPDPPGGTSINNPGAVTITGAPPDTVDFDGVPAGCYWFRYETPDWVANQCNGCGDCQMYRVTVVEMAEIANPDDLSICDRGPNNCGNNDLVNLWDLFDCNRPNLVAPDCTGNCTHVTGLNCTNATNCIVREFFTNGTNNVFSNADHDVDYSCDVAYSTCECTSGCSVNYHANLNFSIAPGAAYQPATGVFDPCAFAVNNPAPSTLTITLTINQVGSDPVACPECEASQDVVINITLGENAGTTTTGDQVCN